MIEKIDEKLNSCKALYVPLGVALALKIIMLGLNRPFNTDGILYITAAQYFAEGQFAEALAVYPMPLYPLLITVSHFVIPDWELAAKLISTASMVLVLIPLYALTAHLFTRRAAFWACLALALAPVPNDWSVDVIRGPIFVLFTVLTVYAAQMAIDLKTKRFFLLTALLAGISFLFRIEGIIFISFFTLYGMYLLLMKDNGRKLFLKGYSVWIAILVIFTLLACGATYILEKDFNRIEELTTRAEHIVSLGFLDNYYIIYNQLYTLEENSPNSDTNQCFAEVARHFMFLVYVIGEAQDFFKILFPLFIIPFFWGLKRSFHQKQSFLIWLIGFYLFIMYVFYIDRNFLHQRFLFAPAVLAFPWIGAGLDIMFTKIKNSIRPKMYFSVFAVLFLISPSVESVHSLAEENYVLRSAGEWLSEQKWARDGRVLSNEIRGPFFAGLRISNAERTRLPANHDLHKLETRAMNKNIDIIMIEVDKGLDAHYAHPTHFQKVKKITGQKSNVYIYYDPPNVEH